MSITVTQTIIEERLQPATQVASQAASKVTKTPSVLLRSSSFDRLKQFPSSLHAYFCRHGSIEILKWLTYSRTRIYSNVSQLFNQLRGLLLVTSVYAAVGLISIQLGMCLLALATIALPSGLTFLLACIVTMAVIAAKLNLNLCIAPHQRRKSRSRTRHVKQE